MRELILIPQLQVLFRDDGLKNILRIKPVSQKISFLFRKRFPHYNIIFINASITVSFIKFLYFYKVVNTAHIDNSNFPCISLHIWCNENCFSSYLCANAFRLLLTSFFRQRLFILIKLPLGLV